MAFHPSSRVQQWAAQWPYFPVGACKVLLLVVHYIAFHHFGQLGRQKRKLKWLKWRFLHQPFFSNWAWYTGLSVYLMIYRPFFLHPGWVMIKKKAPGANSCSVRIELRMIWWYGPWKSNQHFLQLGLPTTIFLLGIYHHPKWSSILFFNGQEVSGSGSFFFVLEVSAPVVSSNLPGVKWKYTPLQPLWICNDTLPETNSKSPWK